jgi:hypothetical protein
MKFYEINFVINLYCVISINLHDFSSHDVKPLWDMSGINNFI